MVQMCTYFIEHVLFIAFFFFSRLEINPSISIKSTLFVVGSRIKVTLYIDFKMNKIVKMFSQNVCRRFYFFFNNLHTIMNNKRQCFFFVLFIFFHGSRFYLHFWVELFFFCYFRLRSVRFRGALQYLHGSIFIQPQSFIHLLVVATVVGAAGVRGAADVRYGRSFSVSFQCERNNRNKQLRQQSTATETNIKQLEHKQPNRTM